jgi:hypothetical protein
MDDAQKKSIAWARFLALQHHMPTSWNEGAVHEYHEIVAGLEEAWPGHDLSAFRIPDDRLKQRVIQAQRMSRRGVPGVRVMSNERYCDEQYMHRQIEGISLYFQNLQPPPEPRKIGF